MIDACTRIGILVHRKAYLLLTIMDNQVQEIKSRLDIVDIVSDYVELKKAGINYKGVCPFHNEKSPSFFVNQDKQIFHCFGCNEGGDIYSFLQKIEGINFAESLRILAKRAGVVLERGNPEVYKKKNRAIEIVYLAVQYYYQSLLKSKSGEIARSYLKERHVTDELIDEFQLGYAPDQWDALFTFLLSRGYRDKEIFDAGLVVQKQKGGYYDRFRNRVMFPIRDVNGDFIGFGARKLSEHDKGGKYINSPQSMIYDKSKVIYGLSMAKKAIKEHDYVIVVEGYLDVIANHKVGIQNVVASSGIAFTPDQIRLIKRYTKNIYYCFDNDTAGIQALYRATITGFEEGMNVKTIYIPKSCGKDADECINNNPSTWKQCIEKARDGLDFFIEISAQNISDIRVKAQRIDRLLNMAKYIQNPIEQSHWISKIAQSMDEDIYNIQSRFKALLTGDKRIKRAVVQQEPVPITVEREILKEDTALQKMYVLVMKFYLRYPRLYDGLELDKYIIDPVYKELYNSLNVYYTSSGNALPLNEKGTFEYEEFISKANVQIDKGRLAEYFNKWYIQSEKLTQLSDYTQEYTELIRNIKKGFIKYTLNRVSKQIDKETDEQKIIELTQLSQDLISQYKNL